MMATATKTGYRWWNVKTRHRILVWAGILAAFAIVLALSAYGFHYYLLPASARTLSRQHAQLKPSGSIGRRLGMVGGVLFLFIYLYPLRKHWRWLGKIGKTKNWLDYHILMGLSAPALITFHSSFKMKGVAGLSYWIMMLVVASGVVGRYLYGRIPHRLDAAEMSLDEMRQLSEQLAAQLHDSRVLTPRQLEPLMRLPTAEQVQSMPALWALAVLLWLDLKRPFLLLRLRRETGGLLVRNAELNRVLEIVRKQTALSKNVVFLAKVRQLFNLWHVVHRPFSYSFAVLAVMHVLVAFLFGYF